MYAEHEAEIHFWKFCQYEFSLQWTALKAYAGEICIGDHGDIPIYVAADSAGRMGCAGAVSLMPAAPPKRLAWLPAGRIFGRSQLWGNLL